MSGGPVDEVAVARAVRRLDALIAAHPELVGPSGPDNVSDWIELLETDDKGPHPMPTEKTVQVAFRFSKRLLKRLDEHARRMNAADPGVKYSLTDVVRDLLGRALDQVEAEDKPRGKGAR